MQSTQFASIVLSRSVQSTRMKCACSHKSAVESIGYGASDSQSVDAIVGAAQAACSSLILACVPKTAASPDLSGARVRRLQALASTPLEVAFMVCLCIQPP
jgi:hypothetical protein